MRETSAWPLDQAGSAWVGKRKRSPRRNCCSPHHLPRTAVRSWRNQPVAPERWPLFASFCLVVTGAVVWEMQSTEREAIGHWLSVTLVMAGLLVLYVASSKVRGEFEEEWTELQPSDGRRGSDPLGGRQVRRIRISVAASAVTPWRHLKRMRDLRVHSALRNACERRPTSAMTRLRPPAGPPARQTVPDLKEAGFERLGDLVAANSLTGPGPEDTFRHLSQAQEPEEP